MRGYYALRMLQEAAVDVWRLFAHHIDRSPAKASCIKGVGEGFLVNTRSAARINENRG